MNETDQGRTLPMHTHASTRPGAAVEILPSEILSHVFVVASKSPNDPGTAYINFELLVSHVSRRWRAVSIGMQELWGKLSMHMHLDRVSTYVDRSKAYKLSILIHNSLDGIPMSHFSQCLDSFLQIVNPAASRWQSLIIWTCDHIAMSHVLDCVMRLSVPQLESLQFTQETNDVPSDPIVGGDIFRSFFSGASSLSLVRFHLVHLPWKSFSATNLQQLDIGGLSRHITMNYDQLHQVLTASPRLVKLALMSAFPDVGGHLAYPPIVLPALERLHILSLDPSHNDLSVFHLLSTPVLKSLEIDQIEDLNAFISDVNTTPPKYPFVTSLKLNHISFPLENTDIFSAFPEVSYFDVTGSIAIGMFSRWSHRVIHSDKTVVWPNLHTLSIDRRSSNNIALTRIIKFRNKYGKPLKTLHMTEACHRSYSTRMLQWLTEQVTIEIIPHVSPVPEDGFELMEGIEEEGQDVDGDVDREMGSGFHGPEFDPYGEMYDPNDPPIPRSSTGEDEADNA